MATNRFSYSDDFILKDKKVGINSSTPSEKLDVDGSIGATNFEQSGISTFSAYESYLTSDQTIKGNRVVNTSTVSSSISNKISVGIGDTLSISEGTTIGQGNIQSLKVTNTFTPPIGGTNDRPTAPKPGALFYNKDFRTIEYWDGNFWRQVDNTTSMGRGILAGGFLGKTSPSAREVINYINIPTKGNSQYFGDLTEARARCSAVASSTRACIQMGQYTNKIDYITIQSTGNAVDFGDTFVAACGYRGSAASSTRGLWAGGYVPAPTNNVNSIDYIQIATLGDGIDFGDLTGPRWTTGGLSSPVRAIFGGGYEGPNSGPFIDGHPSVNMDYVTIASKGNAVQFGKLTDKGDYRVGLSNSVRGIYAGGGNPSNKLNTIEYVTIASTGNAQYFGDLTISRQAPGTCSTQTRGTFSGGRTPSFVQVIDYITIASAGNAEVFGDLTDTWFNAAGCSDAHGGLGGF